MWKSIVFFVLLAITAYPAAGPRATYITTDQVAATVAAAPGDRVSDQQIRMVDAGGYHVGVGLVTRPPTTTPSAIVHYNQTEVYHVLEGSGTMVTGGTLAGSRALDPEGAIVKTLTGPSSTGIIEGGETHELAAGDYVIVPAGLAHGFTEIRETMKYVVVRVDPERLVELK